MVTYYLELTQTNENVTGIQNHYKKDVADQSAGVTLYNSMKTDFQDCCSYKARIIECGHDEGIPCVEVWTEEYSL